MLTLTLEYGAYSGEYNIRNIDLVLIREKVFQVERWHCAFRPGTTIKNIKDAPLAVDQSPWASAIAKRNARLDSGVLRGISSSLSLALSRRACLASDSAGGGDSLRIVRFPATKQTLSVT
jgi:hypothetical protein